MVACGLLLGVAPEHGEATEAARRRFDYGVPLDSYSPWPKFRRTAQQDGRSPLTPADSGRTPWVFRTGKGVFSSPVIDAEGTIYIGSGDRFFYAIDRDGGLKWKALTGEIIDSSALLDDQGRVIVGSGDGYLYAFKRDTGERLWTFAADPPAATGGFINWFEGNVAIGADGTLFVPNDNFCTYAVRRETGERVWCLLTRDQTWSLPAVNPVTGRLFVGNNFAFFRNLFEVNASTGKALWHASAGGSIAASPLLIGDRQLVVVGAFDGYVRAHNEGSGRERWRFGARDHVYASPAEAADGTVIQPSADGTVYALDPEHGTVRWVFDTLEPIRSSPAIDGRGLIYFGSGEGRLFVLNPDGTLRWSLRLIDGPRDDLNASPALGLDAIVIAGEDGGVFSVPYDYCLRPGLHDPRCGGGQTEGLPDDGALVLYTTPFGRPLLDPPAEVEANQPLTLSLLVRRGGTTQLALIDSASVQVTLAPSTPALIDVSADGKFITVIPKTTYAGPEGGALSLQVRGNYLLNPQRDGLRFSGGEVGGAFERTFRFTARPHGERRFAPPIPRTPGDASGVWELYRLAAPLPTILPSYNQIGFDSIHYLIGLVEGDDTRAIGWAVGGRLAGAENRTEVDPTSRVRFPLEIRADGALLTMVNEAGFTIEFNGFPLPFEFFRVAARIGEDGEARHSASVNSHATCGLIDFYGDFLRELGYCNPATDLLNVAGAAELRPHRGGPVAAPAGLGRVSIAAGSDGITATVDDSQLRLAEHNIGLLVIDAQSGLPVPLPYTKGTSYESDEDGALLAATLAVAPGVLRGPARVYVMVDMYPAAVATVTFPESVPVSTQVAHRLRSAWRATAKTSGRLFRRIALRLMQAVS